MKTIDFAPRLNCLETRSGYNQLDTFCEFLDHLGRIPRLRGDETAPDETHGTNL
jgi:hypothetical protein